MQIENGRFLCNFDDKKSHGEICFARQVAGRVREESRREGEGEKCEFKDARGREGSSESRKNRKVGRGTVGRRNGEEGERRRDVFVKESMFGKKKEEAGWREKFKEERGESRESGRRWKPAWWKQATKR